MMPREICRATIVAGLLLTTIGCQAPVDVDALRAELVTLHQAEIRAHLEGDVDFLVDSMADEVVEVSLGEIRRPTRESTRAIFIDYLGSTEFSEYRDLEEPVAGISRDGSLGWIIARVQVAGTHRMDDGELGELDFICAFITLYERREGQWIRQVDVSTFPR